MNNKIESLKKELKDAYVDGYVAETYAAQDAREDLLSFAVDVIADLFCERLDREEVAESIDFFTKLMQRQYFLTPRIPRSVKHDKAIHAFAEALTIIDKMHCENQDDIPDVIANYFTTAAVYDDSVYNVSYLNVKFDICVGRNVSGYKFYTFPDPTVNVLESYTFPDSTANVFSKECRHIDSLSASELDEAYKLAKAAIDKEKESNEACKLAKAEMNKEKESNNAALSKADDNTSKLEFAKENLENLLTHLLDLNSNPTDQSPLDQLKGKYCSIESKLEANNIYIVVYGNISVKILIKQNPDGTYHFKRIGKVYVLGADGKYACDLPKEDLMEIEERVREDATEFESNKPSDKKASDEDDECNESETSFSPEKALESAISHLKDKISEKTGIDPDKIDVEVRKVDLASLFKKIMEDCDVLSDNEE